MYTTIAPRKFKEKVYKKKRVCKESMKLKVETSTQQLKKVAKSGWTQFIKQQRWKNLEMG